MSAGTPTDSAERSSDYGEPERDLRDDSRADPRMVAALAPFGFDQAQAPPPVSASSPHEDLLAYVAGVEEGFGAVFGALFAGLPPVDGVTQETTTILGPDDNEIPLVVHRPTESNGSAATRPCVVHFHGGGGVVLSALDPSYVRWRDELASSGLVVIGVEFRNAGGRLGVHPYPAGLRDCAAATQWVVNHKAGLGVHSVIVSGESGGGNLALAVAIEAKREGWVHGLDGVYAMAPMIAPPWNKPADFPSQRENDGYLISTRLLAIMGAVYDPLGAHADDPLCWPYRANSDLQGLPPHVLSVNELDPLRDEGLAYQRRLVANGVNAVARTVKGTVHGGDMYFRAAMPEVYAATVRDIHGFASQRRPQS